MFKEKWMKNKITIIINMYSMVETGKRDTIRHEQRINEASGTYNERTNVASTSTYEKVNDGGAIVKSLMKSNEIFAKRKKSHVKC